ncbi:MULTISPECIES: RDD family protein [unclassified Streptomyces]|uniref:RDD family protein n=1 Tax=unclassified Streptomyces TaxID=2593676 RepID=UPI00278BFEE1|nr:MULTISPECIES: RDD family protein [unclassified Streptomyces]
MSFGDPNNPYGQQPPPAPQQQPGNPYGQPQAAPPQQPGYPQAPQQQPGYPQAPQQQPGYPQAPQGPGAYGYPQQQPGVPQQAAYGYQQAPQFGAPGMPQLAGWGSRFGATLIDGLVVGLPVGVLYGVGFLCIAKELFALGLILIVVAALGAIGMGIWMLVQMGSTGQTIGKRTVGIRVLRELDGQPTGFGGAFLRNICHALDAMACYIGFLWPLWDEKNQTFADKICSTVVVKD